MKQEVRIIGGKFRGKKIIFPDSVGLRPTPSRVRETVFNWLMHDIQGSRCLDAFAGSGALGLEAYSRGAKEVWFIEQADKVYSMLKHQLQQFNASSLHVIKKNTYDYLADSTAQFDIIFLDPPFHDNDLPFCIKQIENHPILIEKGLLYVESAKEIIFSATHWQRLKIKQAGQVTFALYQKIAQPCI